MLKAFFMAWRKETQNEQKCNARPTSSPLVSLVTLVSLVSLVSLVPLVTLVSLVSLVSLVPLVTLVTLVFLVSLVPLVSPQKDGRKNHNETINRARIHLPVRVDAEREAAPADRAGDQNEHQVEGEGR